MSPWLGKSRLLSTFQAWSLPVQTSDEEEPMIFSDWPVHETPTICRVRAVVCVSSETDFKQSGNRLVFNFRRNGKFIDMY